MDVYWLSELWITRAMDSRLLEYFLRVAELGSINKAAADLHLSQPALSRHVAALEHEFGAPLFHRTQAGVSLTESGKLLSDRARMLLRQFALLKEQVREQVAGQVAIGIPPSWQEVITVPFIEGMAAAHPGVFLRLYEAVSHMLREYMVAGLLDLAVMPFEEVAPAGYSQIPLAREPLVLVRASSEGVPSEAVSVSSLSGIRLVLPGRSNVLRVLIEHALRRKSVDFRIELEADTLQLCLAVARAGLAATIAPASALHDRTMNQGLSWVPVGGMLVTWALFENQARTHSQAVVQGRKLVMSTVAERLASSKWVGAEAPRGSQARK
jgi:LysR family transcriptional regulator, nitrogen assimilation regulatory protein